MMLKNKKYYIYIILIMTIILILFGIWLIKSREGNKGSREIDTEGNYPFIESDTQGAGKSINQAAATGDGVITWTVPDYCIIDNEIINKFNNQLKEDGYSFSLSFKAIGLEEYLKVLEEKLILNNTDIASLIDFSEYSQVVSIIRKGYFQDLDEYLTSEEGKSLYNAYDKSLWKGTEVEGRVYTIPSSMMMDGNTIIFNKEYVPASKAASFSGNLEDLYMLIDNDIIENKDITPIIYSKSGFNFSGFLGYEYQMGVFLDSRTGDVVNPYETEELYKYLSNLNDFKKRGYLEDGLSIHINYGSKNRKNNITEGNYVAAIGVDPAITEKIYDDIYIYNLPFYIVSRISGSVAITKNSNNKEAALQLLTLLHTDEKYANLLIYGEEGVDYQLINGFVYKMDGSPLYRFSTELGLGIYDTVHPAEGDYYAIDRKQQKHDLYNSDARHDSVLLGFQINSDDFTDEMYRVESISESYLDIWKEDNFEELYQEAREVVGDVSKDLIEELERQIEQWRELYADK